MREIEQAQLAPLTTIGLGGQAQALLILDGVPEEDLPCAFERVQSLGGSPFVLGCGSNLLVRQGVHPLVVLKPAWHEPPKIIGAEGEKVFVQVGAGMRLATLLRFAAREGLSGLEGLIGIPGSIGGAIAMNAGSFGSEVCKNLSSVTLWQDGKLQTVPKEAITYGYRHFSFAGQGDFFLLLRAIFCLIKGPKSVISQKMCLNFFEKKTRQPLKAKSAGCVFRNPQGDSAGRLLESCGMKGKTLGGMSFSTLHANFLINNGNGTADQALELIELAKEAVLRVHGIQLQPEVRIVPCRES